MLEFQRLFDIQCTLPRLSLHNRLVLPPMATSKSQSGGDASPELIDYYRMMTKGGYLGLVILEHGYMDPLGRASDNQLAYLPHSDLDQLKRLVDAIKENGTKVFAQINHAGAKVPQDRKEILGVSRGVTILPQSSCESFRQMDQRAIERFKEKFLASSNLVKKVGFDGLEIHSAHGYLLNQFYSPLSNRRQDDYGPQRIENRLRLHLELLELLRQELGDFPLAMRLGANDYSPGGSSTADSVKAAILLEEAGLDILDISGGHSGYKSYSSMEGYFKEVSLEIKKHCTLPIILTGGITSREGADELLQEKAADLIGVGRAFLKDPLWGQRALGTQG